VVFSDHRALGPLRTGTAIDRSTGGLRIVTAFPEPMGSTIQIELQHSTTGAVTLLEGRVMHVAPAENGLYAMGIRLASRMLRPPAPTRVAGGSAAGTPRAVAAAARKLDVTIGVPGDAGGAAAATMDAEAVTFRRVDARSRAGSWAALLAILALLTILVLLILQALKEQQRAASRGPGGTTTEEAQPADLALTREPAGVFTEPSKRLLGDARSGGHEPQRFPASRLPVAYAGVRSPVDGIFQSVPGIPQASLEGGSAPATVPARQAMTADRFVGLLEYAESARERGETGLALAVARRAMRDSDAIAQPWREYGAQMIETFSRRDAAREASGFNELVGLEAAGRETSNSGIRIEVDASDHLMRVWRDDTELAEFPVGLGHEGATPRGMFRIANKVSDPSWYPEDGRVVPAGDPGNPIGPQWLGLANAGRPSGIGIHPTQESASIGGNDSQGCVRMRPSDAESLYRLVPIGTPVRIRD
jgi:lipoprotein-anchoring transpeptidase ErfK/SrfK